MKKSEPIIFFGTEQFSTPTLEALINDAFNVVAVVTKPDSKRGRNKIFIPPVKQLALDNGIDVYQPNDLSELPAQLNKYSANFGVLVSYGRIIPENLLNSFEAIVNVHPSLLPKYRGSSPIEQAILNGDSITGVSIMKLVQEMDAGPVYSQTEISLNGSEKKPDLYSTLSNLGAKKIIQELPKIMSGELQPTDQSGEVSFAPMIKKTDGEIDWSLPADLIEKQIRAYLGWPGSYSFIQDQRIVITDAEVLTDNGTVGSHKLDNEIIFYCGQGALKILRLTPAGRTNMSADEFLRGL